MLPRKILHLVALPVILLLGATMLTGCGRIRAIVNGFPNVWIGSNTTEILLLQLTRNADALTGTLDDVDKTKTGPLTSEHKTTHLAVTGNIDGSAITLTFEVGFGFATSLSGTISADEMVLQLPTDTGQITPMTLRPSSIDHYNRLLGELDSARTAGQAPTRPGSDATTPTVVTVGRLKVGDCMTTVEDSNSVTQVPTVPCSMPHHAEVYAIFDISGNGYPGDSAVQDAAETGCDSRLKTLSTKAYDDQNLSIYYLMPTTQTWAAGDRSVICIANDQDHNRTGSIKD